jgi:hypothetical protein
VGLFAVPLGACSMTPPPPFFLLHPILWLMHVLNSGISITLWMLWLWKNILSTGFD